MTEPRQPTARRLILDDDWEPPPRPRRRPVLVAACMGTALVVAGVAFFKASAGISRPDDERNWRPSATRYEAHDSGGGGVPIATVPTAVASDSVHRAEPARPAPRPRAAAPAPRRLRAPAYLSVNSRPWAELSVDGQVVGNTPQVRVRVVPGRHHLVLARRGFQTHSAWVDVPPGATVRLTNITLTEIAP